jgi:hypothetical protein
MVVRISKSGYTWPKLPFYNRTCPDIGLWLFIEICMPKCCFTLNYVTSGNVLHWKLSVIHKSLIRLRQNKIFSFFTRGPQHYNQTVFTCKTLGGHMSILVTTTKTGTLRAKARPKCSLVMPTIPALAPIINMPKSERPKNLKSHFNFISINWNSTCFEVYLLLMLNKKSIKLSYFYWGMQC